MDYTNRVLVLLPIGVVGFFAVLTYWKTVDIERTIKHMADQLDAVATGAETTKVTGEDPGVPATPAPPSA